MISSSNPWWTHHAFTLACTCQLLVAPACTRRHDGPGAPVDDGRGDTSVPGDSARESGAAHTGGPIPDDSGAPGPSGRPLEVDPWGDDWTIAVPWYLPEPACESDVAARIDGVPFATIQAALEVAVDEDIIVLCDGVHDEALRFPVDTKLELRGRTGRPEDVILTSSVGRTLSFDGVDPADGGMAFVRLSGLEWREMGDEHAGRHWFARAWQLRDVRRTSHHLAPFLRAQEDIVVQSVIVDVDEQMDGQSLYLDILGVEGGRGRVIVHDLRSALPVTLECWHSCRAVEVVRLWHEPRATGSSVRISMGGRSAKDVVLQDVRLVNVERGLSVFAQDGPVTLSVYGLLLRDSQVSDVIVFADLTGTADITGEIRNVSTINTVGPPFHGQGLNLELRPGARVHLDLQDVSFPPGADTITGCGSYSYISRGVVDPALGVCP